MGEVTLLANIHEEPYMGQSGLTPPLSTLRPSKISLVSGGFDPLHSGHISLIHGAKNLTGFVVVAINSDEWLQRKKGRSFMPIDERRLIIDNLKHVSNVIEFDDSDDTATDAIIKCKQMYPKSAIVFCNGGDRTPTNVPEGAIPGVELAFNVGGDSKLNSSSLLLEDYKYPKTDRPWGYYRVLFKYGEVDNEVKVKELTVNPYAHLSMQRHERRKEFWFISEGEASIYTLNVSSDMDLHCVLKLHKTCHIQANQWHMLRNETDRPLRVIEIQYGTQCVESDIERKGLH